MCRLKLHLHLPFMALNDSLGTVEEIRTAVTLSASQHPAKSVVIVVRVLAQWRSVRIKNASSCCGLGLKSKKQKPHRAPARLASEKFLREWWQVRLCLAAGGRTRDRTGVKLYTTVVGTSGNTFKIKLMWSTVKPVGIQFQRKGICIYSLIFSFHLVFCILVFVSYIIIYLMSLQCMVSEDKSRHYKSYILKGSVACFWFLSPLLLWNYQHQRLLFPVTFAPLSPPRTPVGEIQLEVILGCV